MQKRDIEFLYEMGTIRYVQRTWRQFLGADFANLAEHTYRVAWIALVIAKNEGVEDIGKVLKMALVHDISESRAGDVHYLSRQYVVRKEEEAIEDMLANTALASDFIDLWKEYEKRECIEARVVKDADNIDIDMELIEQRANGCELWKNKYEMRKKVSETKLYTKTAKQIWDQLYDSDPHAWHHNAPNRFQAGDWSK
ncbi:MAG: HD domain-containing protein [Patescibacteria group bacterium]